MGSFGGVSGVTASGSASFTASGSFRLTAYGFGGEGLRLGFQRLTARRGRLTASWGLRLTASGTARGSFRGRFGGFGFRLNQQHKKRTPNSTPNSTANPRYINGSKGYNNTANSTQSTHLTAQTTNTLLIFKQ